MSQITRDPFDGLILDAEEQAIENAAVDFASVPDFKENKKLVEQAALQYIQLNTSRPITLRVKQTDLIKIKAKAKRSSIPYQTLLGALLHDFAEDKRELKIK
jgi:predicted DNA binding CopG/RHH family protein